MGRTCRSRIKKIERIAVDSKGDGEKARKRSEKEAKGDGLITLLFASQKSPNQS